MKRMVATSLLLASVVAAFCVAQAAAAQFQQPFAGATPRSENSKLADIVNAQDFAPTATTTLCTGNSQPLSSTFSTLAAAQAKYSFVTSLTQEADYAAIQAAINARSSGSQVGGQIHIPRGQCLIGTSTLAVTADGIFLAGESPSGRSSAGTTLVFAASSNDAITFGPLTGGGLRNLRLDGSARTGTSSLVSVTRAAKLTFENLEIRIRNGFTLYATNNISLDKISGYGQSASATGTYAIKWYGDQNGSGGNRADVLQVRNFSINMQSGGGDCVLWDGMAHTMTMHSVRCIGGATGLLVTNTTGDSSFFPMAAELFGFEVDGGTGPAVHIAAGRGFKFHAADLFGSSADAAIQIDDDSIGANASFVSDIEFIGGRIGNSNKECAVIKGRNVRLIGVHWGTCSKAGLASYDGISIVSPAQRVQVIGGGHTAWGDGINARYAIAIGSGTDFIDIVYPELSNYQTAALSNSSAGSNINIKYRDVDGLPAGGYRNFGNAYGSSGYGLRDNGGSIERKHSGGSWSPIVGQSRSIATTAPLSGGGDLSADRTLSIAANGISNSLLAQMSNNTVKCNVSGATANASDCTIGSLTSSQIQKATPVPSTDMLLGYDAAGATSKKFSAESLALPATRQTGYMTGRYYTGGNGSPAGTSSIAMVADTLYATPFYVGARVTWTTQAIEVVTGAASSFIRLGIFDATGSGGGPGSLVLDSCAVDSSTTGVKTCTISRTLEVGLYYLVAVSNGTPTVRAFAGVGNAANSNLPSDVFGVAAPGTGDIQASKSFACGASCANPLSGASPFGAITFANASTVMMLMKP